MTYDEEDLLKLFTLVVHLRCQGTLVHCQKLRVLYILKKTWYEYPILIEQIPYPTESPMGHGLPITESEIRCRA